MKKGSSDHLKPFIFVQGLIRYVSQYHNWIVQKKMTEESARLQNNVTLNVGAWELYGVRQDGDAASE